MSSLTQMLVPELLLVVARNLGPCDRAHLRAVSRLLWETDHAFRLPRPIHRAMAYRSLRWPREMRAAVSQWLSLCDTPLFRLFDRQRFVVTIEDKEWTLTAKVWRGTKPELFVLGFKILGALLVQMTQKQEGVNALTFVCDMTLSCFHLDGLLTAARPFAPEVFAYLEDETPVVQELSASGPVFRVCQ